MYRRKYSFIVVMLWLSGALAFASSPQATTITAAEYFIDTDPGQGLGTSLYAVDGTFDEATEEVQGTFNTSGLSVGTHTVYVRMRDSEGNWGAARGQSFTVKSPITPKYIAGAEYFIDTDPGQGLGTSLYAVDGTFDEATEEVQATFNTSGLS
ncbi:MAG: hypothetical protein KAV99_03495, partial [Candidatus Latescibacteria bacterium]|nr:hypothetical protein [Candidatus Latescibacterota bacterium]